ncbi:hypothetical protein [Halalkalicoccus sp. NIPERK01]|nr:hypothetical protein [Halalkalicoccus sp. NIPERK01]MDL5363343.1 hypothetical protein [Halalkalicoccus sp. NIPERK01]
MEETEIHPLPPEIDDQGNETLDEDEVVDCEHPKGLDEVFEQGV